MPGLELRGVELGVGRGDDVLFDAVSLVCPPGSLFVVTGPSGTGKSVLAAVLSGHLLPDRGEVLVDDRPLPPVGADPRRPAYVAQDGWLVESLTVAETVGLPMQVARIAPAEIATRSQHWLGVLGLGGCLDRPVAELSGGQRQRVSLARAFALSAPVAVFDEPTAELDADNRAIVLERLQSERDRGGAVLVVSHDPDVIAAADLTYELGATPATAPA